MTPIPPNERSELVFSKEQQMDMERISRNFDKGPFPLHNIKSARSPMSVKNCKNR